MCRNGPQQSVGPVELLRVFLIHSLEALVSTFFYPGSPRRLASRPPSFQLVRADFLYLAQDILVNAG